ncbi:helix-turn-helix domain-containing protein [Nocardia rhamnosiphila]|uniref:XRE family transcriptional regulator n=1 Tax=Nocardia rhamnosiphila TaxID=426716 RepID=A0ABV2WN57_9NOCA
MDETLLAVGERIRSRMPADLSQRRLAQLADMKPDALSRALNGQRGFSSVELAKIADQLDADLYWLVTGQRDPHRVEIAARHSWDWERGTRANPGRPRDDEILEQVVTAYRVAFPEGPPPSEPLPEDPVGMREILGEEFARAYVAVVQDKLGVDVVRLPRLTTDYSLTIGSRAIVILATTPNWFRSNWSLAHELAHLALGHHDGHTAPNEASEQPADRFAAELLLPSRVVGREDWGQMDELRLADFLWRTGVSAAALRRRLADLKIRPSSAAAAALKETTPKLIRNVVRSNPGTISDENQVTLRQQESSTRLVPAVLVEALQRRVEAGEISPEPLAWALDVEVDEVDFPEPDDDALADAYQQVVEDRPSIASLNDWLATSSRSVQ